MLIIIIIIIIVIVIVNILTKFLVTPLLMGLVCLLSQGRFEEPVRPCQHLHLWTLLSMAVRPRQIQMESGERRDGYAFVIMMLMTMVM